MRQFLLGLSISVAFIVGCVTAQHVPELGVATASAYAGQRWEYNCTGFPRLGLHEDDNLVTLTAHLNQLGTDGWELSPLPWAGTSNTALCFKRPA